MKLGIPRTMAATLALASAATFCSCTQLGFNTPPGPAFVIENTCNDAFIAGQRADLEARAIEPCYRAPYEGYASGCAQCHGNGTHAGLGSDWGPSPNVDDGGWLDAVVENALRSNLANVEATNLLRTLDGREGNGHHPNQADCASSMNAWLAAFAVGCGGDAPVDDAGVVDAGQVDAGQVDAGPVDAGQVDAGPPPVVDAGPCVDGGPWPDEASLAVFVDLGLATKLLACHDCHDGAPDVRGPGWGTPENTAEGWHTAVRTLHGAQADLEPSATSLVNRLSVLHFGEPADPPAAASMVAWIEFIRTCGL